MTSKQAVLELIELLKKYQHKIVNEDIEIITIKGYPLDRIIQDLERLEKLEKVIKIFKHKIEFENLGEMQSGCVFRGYFNDCFDEYEYESLNEVFKNDK